MVNSPHPTRELFAFWALALGAMLAGGWLLVARPPQSAAWLGGLVVNLTGLGFGVGGTLLLLFRQVGVRREGDRLVVFRWLAYLRGFQPDHLVPIAAIQRARMAWPLRITLETVDGPVVISTFWWRPPQYRAFEILVRAVNVEVVYDREYPGRMKGRAEQD